FSTGNGSSDFRLPDLRGEFIRGWDDVGSIDANRTIGSWQDSQNRSHTHGGTASSVDNHTHGAATSTTGTHAHALNDSGHHHQYSTRSGVA
ncbi:hypothetical protein LAN33_24035, partial [Mycobacterium tuberculosis]|nr:hypothetical protein [Mycobacterium tuberculosis]